MKEQNETHKTEHDCDANTKQIACNIKGSFLKVLVKEIM